jgi:hypothetical protein
MKTRLIQFILFILTFTCYTTNSLSQTDSTHSSYAANSLVKGWSAQFELGTYINSGKFETFLISFKRHFSKCTALRLGFGYDNISNDGTVGVMSNGIAFSHPTVTKAETFSGVLSFLYYMNPQKPVNVFIGAGPIYKYHYQKTSNYSASFGYSNAYANFYDNSEKNWSAGLNGVFGVEWFPFSCISFVAEYNANVMYGKSTATWSNSFYVPNEPVSISQDSSDGNTVTISFNIVRLGISAYF